MTLTNNIFIYLFMLVPFFLITGPAIPDIIITICSIYFLFTFIILRKDYEFLKDKLFIASIIFWFSIIFISFFAFNKFKSFQDSIIFIRLLMIPTICYFLFFKIEKNIKRVVSIIFLCVIFVIIDTLFQYFNYSSEFGFKEDLLGFKSKWYGRLTGPFGDELVPGAYLSKFGLIGYLFFFFYKDIRFKKIFETLYLSLIGFVCFASGERMALATFFLALFFLFIFLKNKRLILFFAIFLSIAFIIFSMKIHPFYNDYNVINSTHYHQGLKIEKIFNCSENNINKCTKIINLQPSLIEVLKNFSSSAYGEIYNVGINMFKDNLITGVGISNYQISCNNITKYKSLMLNYDCASHPHNTYIHWLAEGGLITFFSFIFLIITIIFLLIKGKNENIFNYIAIACIIILFWPIMSTGSLIKNWNGVLTFYIIGLIVSLNRVKIT